MLRQRISTFLMITSLLIVYPLARICVANEPKPMVVGYVFATADADAMSDNKVFDKLTHLCLAFANPRDATGVIELPEASHVLITAAHSSHVKVLASLGGGSASEDQAMRERYFELINVQNRPRFIENIISLVKKYELDGIDLDLEGPAINSDYDGFVAALAERLHAQEKILSAALSRGYGGESVPDSTILRFDFINVMAYDAKGSWNPTDAGQHSSFGFAQQNARYWIDRGLAKERLVLGVPFYGYGFGNDFKGGGYSYREIVRMHPIAPDHDEVGDTIFYNGRDTIRQKTEHVLEQGYGGIMIWELTQDARGNLSLLQVIHDTIQADSVSANRK